MKHLLKKLKKLNIGKRIISIILVIILVLGLAPFESVLQAVIDFPVLVVHATPRKQTVQINDLSSLVTYSLQYSANPEYYSEDILELSLNEGNKNDINDSYIPLGTKTYPFNGEIYITQNYGENWYFDSSKPLFDYVTDSVKINYSDTLHRNEPIEIELRRRKKNDDTLNLSPLFANYVTHDSGAETTWKIKSAPYVDQANNVWTYNFAGLIGTVGDGTEGVEVSIHFNNSSNDTLSGRNSNVVTTGDGGLICGTLSDYSKINLTLSGSNTSCNIGPTDSEPSTGNVGGLIGTMGTGSVLNIERNTFVPVPTRTITATDGYAGGIVGYCNGGKVIFPEPGEGETAVYVAVNETITGTSGAGALAGYYSNYVELVTEGEGENVVSTPTPQPVNIDLKNYDIDCTVSASAAGGLFGVLNSTADIKIDGTSNDANEISVTGSSVTNFGGIAGTYSTSALTNSFEIDTATVNTGATFSGTSYYGGICGQITGTQAAYVKVSNLTHKSSSGFADATAFGGVVGNAGTAGSMLDVGSVTIETGVTTEGEGATPNGSAYKGGGIVGKLTDGVLRLSGTTDLSKAPSTPATAKNGDVAEYKESGQIVGIRKDSLVYAVGSGNTGDSNWVFNRSATPVNADDIATWGSILRPDATNLSLADFETKDGAETPGVLDFHTTNHTVTVSAPVTAMTSAADYTKTALNMQLNSGDKGALKFSYSTNTTTSPKETLLGTNLSFTGTIDLSGTGNIGLMRDDYKDNVSEIGVYTKTISGGTVKLAIGERYGSTSTGVGRGDIVAHRYNGLLARTGSNATISGITIDGTINVNSVVTNTHVGGGVAFAENGITLTNIIAQETINFNAISGTGHVVGGMAASVSGGNTGISGGTAKTKIVLNGNYKSGNETNYIPVGGAIGKINNASKKITVSTITVASDIDASGATAKDMAGAGFIADISGGTMSLTGVTVNGTKLKNRATDHTGGFLGYQWLKTDVEFTATNGVILSGTNNENDTTGSFATGLVQKATGHWTVPEKGIKIWGMTIKTVSNSLAFLVHDGYSGADGLYLELTHKDSYDLASNGITVPSTTYYDELVRSTGTDILSNRSNGIISITTDGDLIMNGTSCNTYQNKYNKTNVTNEKSRYYYNLTRITDKEADDRSAGEKLLLWSLNNYAADNIKGNFTDSFGTDALSGTFNLEHISYYPIDIGSNQAIGEATFIFYNDKIEASENGTGNSDDSIRTTRGASQHFLMHSGVFRNVTAELSTSGNIHFKGSIGVGSHTEKIDSTNVTVVYSGALINGTLSGTLTTATDKEIVFEGLKISDATKYLFINKLTTNSKMTLSGVRTGGGQDFSNADKSTTETGYTPGATVANSLIGDVSGNGIQISFERIKLDSRTTAGSPTDLSAQYGTTKSIFSGATLLNRFAVDNNSTGTYNFEESLDWVSGTHNANVTYGQEIKTSVEYANKQQKYFDQAHYVDPATDPSSRNDVYSFDSGFLPYVKFSTATVDSGTDATRELKVNVSVAGITEGCGTYNHPYEITLGTQLVNVATAINKTAYPNKLRLPKIQGGSYATAVSNHWCDTKNITCAEFTHGSGNYTYTEGNKTYTWTEEQVSLYLASAYYIIKKNITISGAYPGLGASPANDKTSKYAFRGVIVGSSSDGSIKITNESVRYQVTSGDDDRYNTSGLITMSNGCVVKNLTIEVDIPAADLYNYRSNENMAYGYNEDFPNYGAVINKIMGGDNIIDNVSVTYKNNFKIRDGNDYKATVGGYVGCVVNGGLIFRNVDDNSLTGFVVKKVNSSGTVQDVTCNGNTITNLTDEDDLIHIHVNPFVGRVINGYAIRESTTVTKENAQGEEETVETAHYSFSEDGETYGDDVSRANAVKVTMHNTRKNYSIPDINTDNTNKLTFSQSTEGGTYDTISVPDGQALYIMSIIAQSGSGCATEDGGEYAYNISYDGNATRGYSGNQKQNNKATHWASYSDIGSDTKGDDYNLSKNDTINSKTAIPYIIQKYTSSYTSGNTTYYPARTLTKRTFYINLVAGTIYYLPDSFRGIGFLGSNNLDDNMKIYGINGNGTKTDPTIIDVNTEYFLNKQGDDPYFGSNIGKEYQVGIGLFNNLKQSSSTGFDRQYENDSKYQIANFSLQGYLSAHHVNSSGVDQNAEPKDNRDGTFMNTAGLIPTVLFSEVTLYNFYNIMFSNLHIDSHAYAAGFVAYANSSSVMIYINNCNADGYKVEGSGRVAGFVGSYDTTVALDSGLHINTGLDSSEKDSFTSVMRNTIISNKYSGDTKHNYTAGILGSVYSNLTSNYNLPADNGDNARGHLILRNVVIEGGNAETNYIGNKNNPSGSTGGIIGGGSAKVNGCLIENCIVKDIDIYGKYAGGIMGEDANRNSGSGSKTGARIVGCTVTGTLDEDNNPQYSIRGLYYAGGVYGDTKDINTSIHPKYKSVSEGDDDYVEFKTDIDGVYIYGYNIYSVNENNADAAFDNDNGHLKTRVAAGGLIGSNNENRTIQNCKVEKCVIDVGTNSESANNTPCGGLIGQLNSGYIYGYNIEVKDCDFYTHQWVKESTTEGVTTPAHAINTKPAYKTDTSTPVTGMKCGNAVGNVNSKTIKIIAFHSDNCPASNENTSNDFYGITNASYIVYADYNGVCNTLGKGTDMSSLTTNSYTVGSTTTNYTLVDEGGLKEYFPHVSVSPVIAMGKDSTNNNAKVFLTGDGAALYSDPNDSNTKKPIAHAIVNGTEYSNVVGENPGDAVAAALSSGESTNGISTYETEMGSLPSGVEDFAVVTISTENADDATALINNYIKTVTNTTINYYANSKENTTSSSLSDKYRINIYPCSYNSSKGCYEINATGKIAGLKTDEDRYKMAGGYADSNQGDYQFSLVDVMFLDPSDNTKIAYHLFVPVLTKKMMMFEFKSASLSGTDIKSTNFTHYGNTLAENLNSWFTGYVHYGYSQSELQSLLDSGAGLDWNSSKTILLKYTTSTVEAKLGENTQIVLIDRNNEDKYYYAKLGDLRGNNDTDGSNDSLTMSSFNSQVDGQGTAFTPAPFADMLNDQGFSVVVTTSDRTRNDYYYVETNDPSLATITINGTMYQYVGNTGGDRKLEIKYRYEEDGEIKEDSTKKLEENYYFCFRADGNSVYNYSIRTPFAIPGATGKPTLRVENFNDNEITNIIMGNLYTQDVQIVSVNLVDDDGHRKTANPNTEVDGIYHNLEVKLSTTITLNGTSSEQDFILSHLQNENIHLWHDYVLTLTAKDSSGGTSVEILGSPSVSTQFIIAGNSRSGEDRIVKSGCAGNYIQLGVHDIKEYLSKEPANISASATINFAEAWQYQAEFPVQSGLEQNIGVNVSAKSNLSYQQESLLYTGMTQAPATPSNKYFYIKDSDEASLVYNFKSGILDVYDDAGYSSFNYSQQGENPKNFKETDRMFIPVETVATYDGTKLKSADFKKAKFIKYTLSLYKKTDNGDKVSYVKVDTPSSYLKNELGSEGADSVFIKVNSGVKPEYAMGGIMTLTGSEFVYTAELDSNSFTKVDDQVIDANINFDIITGEGFTDITNPYSNYRVVLDVELLDNENKSIGKNATAHDWVVYTNAKINPTMLSVTESGSQ